MAMASSDLPHTFTTLPTEIRLKIYEALCDYVQVKFSLRRFPRSGEQQRSIFRIIRRTPEHFYPFAILTVNKKITQEVRHIATNCALVLEFEGCITRPSLDTLLPNTVLARIQTIVTDESLWYAAVGSLSCCFNIEIFPSLRHLELRGPPTQIQIPRITVHSLARSDFNGCQLSPEVCIHIQSGWPGWAPQVEPLIVSGLLTITIRCDIVCHGQQVERLGGKTMETSVLGVLLWTQEGMTVTEVFSWKQQRGGVKRDRYVYPDTRPANRRGKSRRRGRNDDEEELSDRGNDEWTL